MVLNPYSQYRQTAIETASPERLIIMVYNGAAKFLRLAKEAIEQGRIEMANNCLCKVQDIIYELILGLDMNAGEIAYNLRSIYDYWNRRLLEANMKKDGIIVDEVLVQVEELRSAWEEIIAKSKETLGKTAGGVNIEG